MFTPPEITQLQNSGLAALAKATGIQAFRVVTACSGACLRTREATRDPDEQKGHQSEQRPSEGRKLVVKGTLGESKRPPVAWWHFVGRRCGAG